MTTTTTTAMKKTKTEKLAEDFVKSAERIAKNPGDANATLKEKEARIRRVTK